MVAAAQGQTGEERERAPSSQNCRSQNGNTANADASSRDGMKERIVRVRSKMAKDAQFLKKIC
jgi:hypothetical protein